MLFAAAWPRLLEGAIPLGIGIVSTLMAFGLLPASPDARKAARWHARWGPRARMGGPLLILVGLILLGRALLSP